jgi:ATP-dependent exoDNAse (exonuclease V) alpha subunit
VESAAAQHLNIRVAWHDDRWNGRICREPSKNAFCIHLDRVRATRNDVLEDGLHETELSELKEGQFPPCQAESGTFMNENPWWRIFEHPYSNNDKAQATHGRLKKTTVKVPPYSTFAIPFRWMLREFQEEIEAALPSKLPPDEKAPFPTPWVFGRERQEALSELFFSRVAPKQSLVFFYTKSGHPLDERINRLIVGVGTLDWMSGLQRYEASGGPRYPLWDRLITHSIRPEGSRGILLPYHDYLNPTGDPDEDRRRRSLADEIAVIPERGYIRSFSHVGEHATHDVALSSLMKCLEAVRLIRAHGIAAGPWPDREEWLNTQIHAVWRNRGAFPGAGAALEAIGMRLGTSMVLELLSAGTLKSNEDPWPLLDAILRGRRAPPQKAYKADVEAVSATWTGLPEERRALLKLLSRFELGLVQAARWFVHAERNKASRGKVTDAAILENPYRIVELDLGDAKERPVPLGMIDRGLMPDATIAAAHPVPPPSHVGSPLDWRRARAVLSAVLRNAGQQGDSLLAENETLDGIGKLDLGQPCPITADWVAGNLKVLEGEIARFEVTVAEDAPPVACLQLADVLEREQKLARILRKRAEVVLEPLRENWAMHVRATIEEQGIEVDLGQRRYADALEEQTKALEQITERKLSVLAGAAGTGKTTVLGALTKSRRLASQGILFLAPTGKARVRLAQKTRQECMTVAQFLYHRHRYDALRQRPLFAGDAPYAKEKTIVIDECSMLTMDDLYAVLLALDLAHVQRIVLVGDPNQLPPIGMGRPYADFVAFLDTAAELARAEAKALARLTVEVRASAGAPSDALRLASWFTREPQPVDADRILSDLEGGKAFNDLEVHYWKTPKELHEKLSALFKTQFGLADENDVKGFNETLGLTPEGWLSFDKHHAAEAFQVLCPIRKHAHGVFELNRWIQGRFRAKQLQSSRQHWGLSLGDEEIVWGDKVILTRNGKRDGWHNRDGKKVEEYLANGEIGIAGQGKRAAKNKVLNVEFVGRGDLAFGFWPQSFGPDGAPLELAYALTIHKAQGSDFEKVFVVIPQRSRLLTREVIYTALTRSKDRLILLLEGDNPAFLYEFFRTSDTARRSTNLFTVGIRAEDSREEGGAKPVKDRYAAHLIYRTSRGEMVRSKSELLIAEKLNTLSMNYQYERPLEGTVREGRLRPDFSFTDDAGNVILWEHLGRMDRADYREGWEWKRQWYAQNGFTKGDNLFTTTELQIRDMNLIDEVARRIQAAL